MLTYDETMNLGAAEYDDVLQRLTFAGFPTTFTQTGGMNAALDVTLEGGYFLLVTDGSEPLTWSRRDLDAWGVGLYRGTTPATDLWRSTKPRTSTSMRCST